MIGYWILGAGQVLEEDARVITLVDLLGAHFLGAVVVLGLTIIAFACWAWTRPRLTPAHFRAMGVLGGVVVFAWAVCMTAASGASASLMRMLRRQGIHVAQELWASFQADTLIREQVAFALLAFGVILSCLAWIGRKRPNGAKD